MVGSLMPIFTGIALAWNAYKQFASTNPQPSLDSITTITHDQLFFYAFSQGKVNAVLHREGQIICILASEMPMDDLLALARSKAQKN